MTKHIADLLKMITLASYENKPEQAVEVSMKHLTDLANEIKYLHKAREADRLKAQNDKAEYIRLMNNKPRILEDYRKHAEGN